MVTYTYKHLATLQCVYWPHYARQLTLTGTSPHSAVQSKNARTDVWHPLVINSVQVSVNVYFLLLCDCRLCFATCSCAKGQCSYVVSFIPVPIPQSQGADGIMFIVYLWVHICMLCTYLPQRGSKFSLSLWYHRILVCLSTEAIRG